MISRNLGNRVGMDRRYSFMVFKEEMIKTAEFYAEQIWQASMAYKNKPYLATEVRVDFSEIVPEGFGTCDCLIIGGDTLCIVDYKHGKGVPVSAENNSQMRLYALGALKQYGILYYIPVIGCQYVLGTLIQYSVQSKLVIAGFLGYIEGHAVGTGI